MLNRDEIQKERARLAEIFSQAPAEIQELAQGLIDDAAFLAVENRRLRGVIEQTGMVRVHPQHPEIQKTTESAGQYLKNVNSYAVVIKALAGMARKVDGEGEDELDRWMREKREAQEG